MQTLESVVWQGPRFSFAQVTLRLVWHYGEMT